MMKRNKGHVVNVASGAGLNGVTGTYHVTTAHAQCECIIPYTYILSCSTPTTVELSLITMRNLNM